MSSEQQVVSSYLPLTTHCLPLTTHCHYLLITTRYSLSTQHSLLLTACNLLLTTHHSPLATHHSLLTTHYQLLTTHYSLLTTHYSQIVSAEKSVHFNGWNALPAGETFAKKGALNSKVRTPCCAVAEIDHSPPTAATRTSLPTSYLQDALSRQRCGDSCFGSGECLLLPTASQSTFYA